MYYTVYLSCECIDNFDAENVIIFKGIEQEELKLLTYLCDKNDIDIIVRPFIKESCGDGCGE